MPPTPTKTPTPIPTNTPVPTLTPTQKPTNTPTPSPSPTPSSTGGTIYYVSNSGGNDANAGTSMQTPWKTITKVNNRPFSPGDSILFKRGDLWTESLQMTSSGTSTKYITYGAYGDGDRPVLDGDNNTYPGGQWSAFAYISGSYVIFENFEVRYASGMGVVNNYGTNNIIRNIYSHHNMENGILVGYGANNTVVEYSDIYYNCKSNEFGASTAGWSTRLS